MKGGLDDIRIYNEVLTPDEVRSSMSGTGVSSLLSVSGMFACWPMENSGTDLSGHGYNLSVNYGAAFTTDRKQGVASLKLDGSNDYAASPSMNPGNEFTVSMWTKIPAGISNIQTLFGNTTSGASSNGFKLYVNTYNTNDQKIAFESGDGTSSAITSSASGLFSFGQWNHIAVTVNRNTGTVKIYYNGTDVTSANAIHTTFKTSGALWLGKMTNSVFAMKGQMDDIRIYNRVLTDPEVKTVMQSYSQDFYKSANSAGGAFNDESLNPGENQDNDKSGINFIAYPNPFSDVINISGNGDINRVEIIDLTGRILQTVVPDGESEISVNTGDLKAGIYLIRVSSTDHRFGVKKVIRY